MDIPPALATAVREGKTVLFLGAGASAEATSPAGKYPPTATQLAALLCDRFLGGNYKDIPLSQVAEYAISEADLRTVQDYVASILTPFQPSPAHLYLPHFSWWGLATSNYDRLIETSYESSPSPYQTPRPLIENGDRVDELMRDPRSVMLLKLHGCITRTANPKCPLILTTDQYVTHRDGRSRIFDHFRGWCFEHPIVFVGYGIQDPDLRAILLEFSTTLEMRPRYYAVMRNADAVQQRYWESKKVTIISATFLDFMRALDAALPTSFRALAPLRSSAPALPIAERFRSAGTTLSPAASQFVSTDVDYVKGVTATDSPSPRDFYKGLSRGWGPIEHRLDVRRALADTILADHFLVEDATHSGSPEVLLLKSHAGAGLSVLMRRLAWDAAHEYDCLCLFLTNHGLVTTSSVRELIEACDRRIYLFVDGAVAHIRELLHLLHNVGADGRRLTLVISERINEWNVSCGDLAPYVTHEHELKYLSSREITQLIHLLEQHRALGTLEGATAEQREAAFRERAGRQLLVALHEATLGQPFEDIIENEFRNIQPHDAQSLYLTICALNRLNVPVRAGIVARLHGIPFADFKVRFFGPLELVVQTELDPILRDYMYRARHPQIAEMVFQRILRTQESRFEQYGMCLGELNVDYSCDRTAFRQMIRGRTVLDLFPNHDLARRVYDIASTRVGVDDPYLLHQLAIYEMNRPNGSLRMSGELLTRASSLAPRDGAIKHSIAEQRLKLAEVAKTALERERLYTEASAIAANLKNSGEDSTFGHHTLVKIGLRRLEDSIANPATPKATLSQQVRDIERNLLDGLQKLPGNAYLLDSEARLAKLLNDSQRMRESLREAFSNNPRNAFVGLRLAAYYTNRGEKQEAKVTLEKALEANPGERRAHFAYAKLLMEMGAPGDQLLYHLHRSFTPGDSNFDAQLLYARQLFINGDSNGSSLVFRALGEAKVGSELRSALLYPLEGRFHGTVGKVEAGYCFIERDGAGEWVFAHRDSLGEALWPRISVGIRLSFKIAFSFRGPRAFEIAYDQEGLLQQSLFS